ncbi:MAG: hypothetical protein AMXMBFR47_22720 [Planctomycetota bacterium]
MAARQWPLVRAGAGNLGNRDDERGDGFIPGLNGVLGEAKAPRKSLGWGLRGCTRPVLADRRLVAHGMTMTGYVCLAHGRLSLGFLLGAVPLLGAVNLETSSTAPVEEQHRAVVGRMDATDRMAGCDSEGGEGRMSRAIAGRP